MMMGLARRLRAMSRDELSWRVRTQLRAHAEEAALAVRPSRWDRETLVQALAAESLPPDTQAALDRHDWPAVHAGLLAVLRDRPARFVLNPASIDTLRREIADRWPGAAADATRRAGAIASGSFDLLGYHALTFDSAASGSIDWHFDPVHQRRMPKAFWSRVPYLDPASGDHKVVWELNRQQHWLALSRALWLTGDRAWAREMIGQLATWMAANPPLVGANWASMLELGFRSLSWLWGLHAMLPSAPAAGEAEWIVDLLLGLDRQLTHVEHNLSRYFSPNTHLTGEALALYVVGAALPELSASARWLDVGRDVLLAEIDRQIESDGGHAERSTHYHRYTLDFYLLALQTARRLGDIDAEDRFAAALDRIVPFARAMADRHGRLPLIGDDDAGRLWPIATRDAVDLRDSLGVAAAVMDRPEWAPWGATEEVLWLTSSDPEAFARALRMDVDDRRVGERRTLAFRASERPVASADTHNLLSFVGRERRRRPERRRRVTTSSLDAAATRGDTRTTEIFGVTGYVTSATESGDHLVIDVGPHGYLNGGHAHADALALVLSLRGLPLLVDPGTPTYTMDGALRDESRSSANHNTVTIDGLSSSIPKGPFHWQSRADAHLEVACPNPRFALIEARHDGYATVGHRRVVFASSYGYLVVDEVIGSGRHEAAQHWHFEPRWSVTCEASRALRMTHESGATAWLAFEGGDVTLINADPTGALGWFSPAYGVRVPSWSARITHPVTAPASFVTWCGVAGEAQIPTLERMTCATDPNVVAVRTRAGATTTVTLLQPGEPLGRRDRLVAVDHLETDARALQAGWVSGRLSSLAIADASHALIGGHVSLSTDAPVADLHLACDGEQLELSAQVPPQTLRLQGEWLRTVRRVTAHGRDIRVTRIAADIFVLTASDWTASVPSSLSTLQEQYDVRNRRIR